jgi:MFS family permease
MDRPAMAAGQAEPPAPPPPRPRDGAALAAVLSTMAVAAIAWGLSLPLLGLLMEQAGAPAGLIGLNTAMPALATVLCTPFVPPVLRRLGTLPTLLGCLALTIATLLAIKAAPNYWWWFPLRFLQGVAIDGLFVTSEAAITTLAPARARGRVLGLYGTVVSGGFALGPALLLMTGIEGWAPFLAGAGLILLAGTPLLLARGDLPGFAGRPSGSLLGVLRAAPAAAGAALTYGAVENGIFNLLPVYGVRAGLRAREAALMVTLVGLGAVICQVPLGWLADRLDPRRLLRACALAGVAGGLSLPLAIGEAWLLWPSLFLWGGVVTGLYTIGLTMLGARFSGPDLASANAAFVTMYGLGGLAGPPLAGGAMDALDPHGLALALALFCAIFVIGLRRH